MRHLSHFLNQLLGYVFRIELAPESELQWRFLLHVLVDDLHTHRHRLPQGNGGECPRRITPHRAPPYEELDLRHKLHICSQENQ